MEDVESYDYDGLLCEIQVDVPTCSGRVVLEVGDVSWVGGDGTVG